MGSARLLTLMAAAVTVAALSGCSNSSRELRTPAQAAGFIAEVAAGEPYDGWQLAGGASTQAAQAWAARVRLADLGHRLRSAARGPASGEPTWTCEMARQLVSLGAVGGVTSFDITDVEIVTKEATQMGHKHADIAAMLHDASTIPFRDLAMATAVACGPKVA
jgi:hypothetical protein